MPSIHISHVLRFVCIRYLIWIDYWRQCVTDFENWLNNDFYVLTIILNNTCILIDVINMVYVFGDCDLLAEVMSLLELLILACNLQMFLNSNWFTVTNPQVRHTIFSPWALANMDLHRGHCFMPIYFINIHILYL